jgi:hypothetical protein
MVALSRLRPGHIVGSQGGSAVLAQAHVLGVFRKMFAISNRPVHVAADDHRYKTKLLKTNE